jgi:hypothetical protein
MIYECRELWEMILVGKPNNLEKTYFSAALSTTHPTWSDTGAKPSLHGERLVTNNLIHGTAQVFTLLLNEFCTSMSLCVTMVDVYLITYIIYNFANFTFILLQFP